jgi:hypothetical protein
VYGGLVLIMFIFISAWWSDVYWTPVCMLRIIKNVHLSMVPGKFIRRLNSLFVDWKVYSSSTNKANNDSHSIFVQQMYWLQDKVKYMYYYNCFVRTKLDIYVLIILIILIWNFVGIKSYMLFTVFGIYKKKGWTQAWYGYWLCYCI